MPKRERVEDGWADLDRYRDRPGLHRSMGQRAARHLHVGAYGLRELHVVHPVFGNDYSSFCLK